MYKLQWCRGDVTAERVNGYRAETSTQVPKLQWCRGDVTACQRRSKIARKGRPKIAHFSLPLNSFLLLPASS